MARTKQTPKRTDDKGKLKTKLRKMTKDFGSAQQTCVRDPPILPRRSAQSTVPSYKGRSKCYYIYSTVKCSHVVSVDNVVKIYLFVQD